MMITLFSYEIKGNDLHLLWQSGQSQTVPLPDVVSSSDAISALRIAYKALLGRCDVQAALVIAKSVLDRHERLGR